MRSLRLSILASVEGFSEVISFWTRRVMDAIRSSCSSRATCSAATASSPSMRSTMDMCSSLKSLSQVLSFASSWRALSTVSPSCFDSIADRRVCRRVMEAFSTPLLLRKLVSARLSSVIVQYDDVIWNRLTAPRGRQYTRAFYNIE